MTGTNRLLALATAGLIVAPAMATDVSGDQSGIWSLANSPYQLVGDVRVPPGASLTIDAGVTVTAAGLYAIIIDQGTLHAVGTPGQQILFTAANTTTGWRGLRLVRANDESELRFCTVEYSKPVGDWQEVRGGAVRFVECSPTIADCELRFNRCHNPNFNGCGAGVTTDSSSARVLNNYIHHNYADSGGGICTAEYGTPQIAGNIIVDNEAPYAGGGIYIGARSSPLIENNQILRNRAGNWGGGGINSWSSFIFYQTFPTIRNNIIARNVSTSGAEACGGGGIYCRYDRAILNGNTIVNNQAVRGGGVYAINYPEQAPIVRNCIVWGNTAGGGGPAVFTYASTASVIDIAYCDVAGGWTGTGNIDMDPLFVNAPADDYHLAPLSPCTDTGDPAFVPAAGETDIDGEARRVDGNADGEEQVDMGADEAAPPCPGDVDGDQDVDLSDLTILLADFGTPECQVGCPGDLDDDDDVDLSDLALLLANFGRSC